MHPSIRIVTFLSFGIFVAFGGFLELLFGFLLVLCFYIVAHAHLLKANWHMLKRMRWLFLSMVIIYLWFTPGEALLSQWPQISPTLEGIKLALLRVGSLVLIVLAVNVLIKAVPHEKTMAGLLWLLTPMRWLGLSQERLALRLTLTFTLIEEVQYVQQLVKKSSSSSVSMGLTQTDGFVARVSRRINAIGDYAATLFNAVLNQAQTTPVQTIALQSDCQAPPLLQWLVPAVLTASFILLDEIYALI
ncbi:hypothetical protein [Kaarinaea lacus]